MAQETEREDLQPEEELEDEEIAELASKKLKEKDKEIKDLKKQLAKEKLLRNPVEEEEKPKRTKEECIEVITGSKTNNYDYAQAVVDLCEIEEEAGNPNPLGRNGKEVKEFFEDVLEECDGDKSRFTAVYQAKIGQDDAKVAMAYRTRNR